jgi:pSer/pThr/pTyr-binding forkhead associated (FHA) protein
MSEFDDEDTWTETTRLTPVRPAALPQSQIVFVLQQVSGPGAPRDFEISLPTTTLGRGSEAEIHIDAPDLSRAHIQLICKRDECHVKDLKSRNGCFLNGVKIHAATLRDGDTLQLGRILFTFYEGRR